MATTKATKATPKKAARTTKVAAKKPAVKKTPARKTVATKKAPVKKTAARKQPEMRSFHVYKDVPPFGTFRISRQTVYWVILMSAIIFAQLYILKAQYEVATILEQQARDIIF